MVYWLLKSIEDLHLIFLCQIPIFFGIPLLSVALVAFVSPVLAGTVWELWDMLFYAASTDELLIEFQDFF